MSVKYGDHIDDVILKHVANDKWKSLYHRLAHRRVNNRVQPRCFAYAIKYIMNTCKEFVSQIRTLTLVPAERVLHVLFGFRLNV